MRFRLLSAFGLDVPVPIGATAEPEEGDPIAVRFSLTAAEHAPYLAALEAWARAAGFRCEAAREAGSVQLRRWARGGYRIVLHVGIDPGQASLVVRSPAAKGARFRAAEWDALLEASTDHEVAALEAATDFGVEVDAATRGIAARLGLEPLGASQPATIAGGVLVDKSRLRLPAGTSEASVVAVDAARHYTLRSTAKLSAASLRKHYRAWAAAQGYAVLGDVYDGEILQLTLRRRTRGVIVAWARGTDQTTLQIGPVRQLFARPGAWPDPAESSPSA